MNIRNLSDAFPQIKIDRQKMFAESAQYSLGQLIDELNSIDATDDCCVMFDFGYFRPDGISSWRGSYDELAIEYSNEGGYDACKFDDFRAQVIACEGKTFSGYKGGDFVMDRQTPLWVSNYGEACNTQVVGIHTELSNSQGAIYRVYIRTAFGEMF